MTVFTRCDACGKEGQPEWRGGSGLAMQGMQYNAGSWGAPFGWNDVLCLLLCADCCGHVKDTIRDMTPPAEP